MKRYEVKCWNCLEVSHETTSTFKKGVACNGSMFRLLQRHRDNGVSGFPEYDTTEYANLVCPWCGIPYVDGDGKLHDDCLTEVEGKPYEAPDMSEPKMVACPVCGELKRPRGLHMHVKFKHPEHYEGR